MRTQILSDALVTIFMHGSSEVTLQKRKKCNKKNIFLRLLSLDFSAKQKMEAFTFDSFGCFRVRFVVIFINNFAFLHDCYLPNKKDQFLFLKAFEQAVLYLNALYILYFCCA